MLKRLLILASSVFSLLVLSSWSLPETEEYPTLAPVITEVYYKDLFPKPKLSIQNNPIDFSLIFKAITPITPIVKKKEPQIPEWILKGILKKETKSYYKETGEIIYKDKKRGAAGERGPFQMTPIAFEQVAKKGEQFWKIEKDLQFAQEMAERYLLYLYNNPAHHHWATAIMMYNTGPTNYYRLRTIAKAYYNDVKTKCE